MGVWSPEFAELKRDWLAMPRKCADEAGQIARAAANACATAIRTETARHWVTGILTQRTYVTRWMKGELQPGWRVKMGAPHAHLFERGTKPRFYVTAPGKTKGSGGKIHATGAGPAKPGFRIMAKAAPAARRQMNAEFLVMLKRQKLEPTVHG